MSAPFRWSRGLVPLPLALTCFMVQAQCGVTLNTFPYVEGFEAAAAWTSGGVANDWAWGAPAHPLINAAGGGSKAWCVGGLSGTSYGDGEQSWLQSPCFDFSALAYPWVSFKLFWECERQYDGLGFQYSLDQGATWYNVGGYGDPTDCLNANWFNTGSITALNMATPKAGWSGRVGPSVGSCSGGQGSQGWVNAAHCMNDLAGEPSVKFRFIFGSGTVCNGYDGIGVDDIFIGNAPPNVPSFTTSCTGNTVTFTNTSLPCQNSTWDFGDPGSGAANTSNLASPTHTYPATGAYQVSLTITGPCNAPAAVIVPVSVLGVEMLTTDPSCAGDDGWVNAIVTGNNGPVTYLWDPGGETIASISGLGPGTYTVTVSGANACAATATAVLEQNAQAPALTETHTDVSCAGLSDGTAHVTAFGGEPPLNYIWAPSGGNSSTANGLAAGTYTCTVSDSQQCTDAIEVIITEPLPVLVVPQADVPVCAGQVTTLTAEASGGVPDYTFTWTPEGPDVAPNVTTVYTVTATDANGCVSTAGETTVTVGQALLPAFMLDDTLGCSPHCVTFTDLTPLSGVRSWDLGDGGTAAEDSIIVHCYTTGGAFDVTLTITDEGGCSGSFTLVDAVDALPSPVAIFEAMPAVTTIKEPTIVFINSSQDAQYVLWHFGDPDDSTSTEFSPRFTYPDVDCYPVRLVVYNDLGCTDSTESTVCVEDPFALYAPNAFTPNGDGYNDVWGVFTSVGAPKNFELNIFDRWGQVLYSTDQKGAPWDGTAGGRDVPPGVYAWLLRIRSTEGSNEDRRGHVTLIR
ncbi:MAG: PKD domain-containing protein [Flavobacteriales bacterium]